MDVDALMIAGLLGALALVLYAAFRANEVFRIAVRDGEVELVRGRPPGGFLEDVRTIAAGSARGTVRAVKRSGKAVLVVEGLDERRAQRLRNAFSTYAMTLSRGRASSRL